MSKSAVVFDALRSVAVGSSRSFENLSILPLLTTEPWSPDYVTLDEALAVGSVTIAEMSEGGSVPELLAINTGRMPVLLLDGEELVLRTDACEARAVQHELDHLDGLVFLDRVSSPAAVFRRKMYR